MLQDMAYPSRRAKGIAVVLVLSSIAALLLIRPASLVNYILDWRIRTGKTVSGRVALLNASLEYNSNYWNPRYLSYALNASSYMEQELIADVIYSRYSTGSIGELKALARKSLSSSMRSNALAVVEAIEQRHMTNAGPHSSEPVLDETH
jgi:hypothetical protein